jgi:hypothetical protein
VEPDNYKPVPNDSRPQPPRDRIAFLAVLTIGGLFILEGHVATTDLVTDLTALAALYGSFHRS